MRQSTEIVGRLSLEIDPQFFAILPALNINLHAGFTFEFEWLIFAAYLHLFRVEKIEADFTSF